MERELRLFVGGYYDDRIFDGEWFDGKTPFNKNINVYSLSEVLLLGFVGNVIEWYNENQDEENRNWNNTTEEEKMNAILKYVEGDEIAGLLYFDNEQDALNYKNEVLKELEELEEKIEYVGKKQDGYGTYREVYVLKEVE